MRLFVVRPRPMGKVKLYLSVQCKASAFEKRWVLKAANYTIASLPMTVAKKFLKQDRIYPLSLLLATPSLIRRLNREYRKKDKVTDVLAFSRLEAVTVPSAEVGDVILCLASAKQQARENGIAYQEELQRLTIHGVLHLFGYDHERNLKEEERMFRLQEKILRHLVAKPRASRNE